MRDLNNCPECNDLLVIGASGTLGCVNDDCTTEVVGMIYEKPITFEEQGELLPKHLVIHGFFDWHKKQGYVSIKREDMEEYVNSLTAKE